MEWGIFGLIMLTAAVAGRAAFSAFALSCGAFTLIFTFVSAVFARRFLLARHGHAATQLPPITVIKPRKGDDRTSTKTSPASAGRIIPAFRSCSASRVPMTRR